MSDVSSWSTTAANNNSSPPDGWPEGMAPSDVNNSARENMAALAKWYQDNNGSLASTGTSGTYAVTLNQNPTELTATSSVVWRSNHANGSATATLNLEALGAKEIRKGQNTRVIEGDIPSGHVCVTIYNRAHDYHELVNPARHRSHPNRNWLLNPGFNVAQRGASFDSTTNPANSDDNYLFDQWILLSDGNDVVDVSRTAQGDATVNPRASFGLLNDIETANKKFAWIQIFSNEKTKALLRAQRGIVSAAVDVVCSNTASSGNVRLYVLAWTGTADSVTSDIISAWGAGATEPTLIANLTNEGNLSITPTTTRTRYELNNVRLDTSSTNNLIFVLLNNDDTTTLTHTITFSAPKLEDGPACTTYQERPYEEELHDAQFYFWRMTRTATSEIIANGFNTSTTTATLMLKLPRTMRTAPTGSVSNVADFVIQDTGASVDTTNVTFAVANINTVGIAGTVAAGLTDGQGSVLQFDATAGGFIQVTSEL